MFEATDTPRVFAMPPGVDFPKALVDGLRARSAGHAPEALARTHLILNTRRMARRVRELFDNGPPALLPRIMLVTDLGEHADAVHLPPAIPPLRRRLELSQLIGRLLETQPDLASRASLFDLSDSLAALIDEMQGEGVRPGAIRNLDVSDLSGHWARAQEFIAIADRFLSSDDDAMDVQARQRCVVERLVSRWQECPPDHPVILAGSTGSRGTTLMLMQSVARLPQGALILPGYDFDQPGSVWDGMNDALLSEDHPQFRFRKLMQVLGIAPRQIARWTDAAPPSTGRNHLVSLALRPAPVTDAWMSEGPDLTDLADATRDVTLIEAGSPRAEALAIAMRLRNAAETGQSAALITPDRMLTRQVSAALDQWGIEPDDSAGLPLHLSPPGRFLRHVAELFVKRLDSEALLTLLKHPLCHTGSDRGAHLLHTRDLELDLRRHGMPFPDPDGLRSAGHRKKLPDAWVDWLCGSFCTHATAGVRHLSDWIDALRATAEAIAAGCGADGSGILWQRNAGQKALACVEDLAAEAGIGGDMTARDFADLLGSVLAGEEVRDRDAGHPGIMIWGTLEARVMGADLLILGGLNEGSWPEAPTPDPWLNRQMRDAAGLLLPERRIGLSAHDFQQAVGAAEVWLTRSRRSDDAETVPSRWLNRLTNLMQGLSETGGPEALGAMRDRGTVWLDWSAQLEAATPAPPARRPAPRPPVSARPRQLAVTEVKRLIRDPYSVYARHVLRLRPLDPLVRAPDALLRGIVVHEILEDFIRRSAVDPATLTQKAFSETVRNLLDRHVPWPTARKLWLARIDRVADEFLRAEQTRRSIAAPLAFEARLRLSLAPLEFNLVGRADRIDRLQDGSLAIYDYKTGAPPTRQQQAKFDKQLLIEAAVAEEGGFEGLEPAKVSRAVFLGLGGGYKEVPAPLDEEPPAKVLSELRTLISAYLEPDQGYSSRRMLHMDSDVGDYDHLARFGEWDRTALPDPEGLR